MLGQGFLGFCIWDIPALILLVAVIIIFFALNHKMKQKEKELEDGLADKWAEESVNADNK